jgi:chromosomal replication initiator protein
MLVVEEIKRSVCVEFGLCKAEIESAVRKRAISMPRMLAMAITRQLTNLSFAQIGQRFGGRAHTTVVRACRRVDPHLAIVAQRLPAKAAPQDWVKALQAMMELSR